MGMTIADAAPSPMHFTRLGQLVEEKIDGGYAAFTDNDEVSSAKLSVPV